MKQPLTLAQSGWASAWVEISVLFVLITAASMHLLDMHWIIAMSVAPVMMLTLLAAVVVLVETMWLVVMGVDRVGAACGLRKSPLA